MELFGLTIENPFQKKPRGLNTFVAPKNQDGAIELASENNGLFGSSIGYWFNLDEVPGTENELIHVYRNLGIQLELDDAIQEICNEAIVLDKENKSVKLDLDEVELSDNIKNKINDEFDYILKLLEFNKMGYGIFRKWYIDGKLLFHKVIDDDVNANKGVLKLIQLDPLEIKLVRELQRKEKDGVEVYNLDEIVEYFVYVPKLIPDKTQLFGDTRTNQTKGLRISREAISYTPSGLLSEDGSTVVSHLHKAIKPFNNLKIMEDSMVIYRASRAPERRVFYIDVGSLSTGKADQHLKDTMNRFKNKIIYNAVDGTIKNRTKFENMMEDYWLPRRDGSSNTEITTLPGAQNLGEIEDVEYFKTKLDRAKNVPLSRLAQDGSLFNIGRPTEITRDEIKFSKFIARLRGNFNELFLDLLKTQLVLKKIITIEEWGDFSHDIIFDYLEDNYFKELKATEIIKDRVELITIMQQSGIIGQYLSHDYIRRNILKQTNDEIKEEDKLIKTERSENKITLNLDLEGNGVEDQPESESESESEPDDDESLPPPLPDEDTTDE